VQKQINRYEAENLQLRLQLRIGDEAQNQEEIEQQRVSEGLEEMLRSGASEAEIWASIEEFKEKYADYGRDRRSAIQFHLSEVEKLLQPTTTTTVAMQAIGHDSKEETDKPGTADPLLISDPSGAIPPPPQNPPASPYVNERSASASESEGRGRMSEEATCG
jgi:hypothetical protein